MAQLQNALPLSLGTNEGNDRVSQRSSFQREGSSGGREQFSDLLSQERQQSASRNADDVSRRERESANNLADRSRAERSTAETTQKRFNEAKRQAEDKRAVDSKQANIEAQRNRDTAPSQRQPVEAPVTDAPEPESEATTLVMGEDAEEKRLSQDGEEETPDWLSLVAAMQAQLKAEDSDSKADMKAQVEELVSEMPDEIQAQLRQLFAEVDGEALVQAFNQMFANLNAGESLSSEQLRAQLEQHVELPQALSDKALAALGLLLQPESNANAQLQLGLNADAAKQLAALTPSDLAIQLGNIKQAIGDKTGTEPSVFIGNPGLKPDMKASADEKVSDIKLAEVTIKPTDEKAMASKLSAEANDEKLPRHAMLGQDADAAKAADSSKAAENSKTLDAGATKLSREEALLAAASVNSERKSGNAVEQVVAESGKKDLSVDASKLVSNDNRNLTQAQQAAKDAQVQAKAPTSFAEAMRQSQQSLELNSQQAPQQLRERLMFMVNNGVQRAEIRLDPPDLGSMSIRVTVQNDQAQVNFQAQNPQAREMLEQAMPRLRELMEQQGLQLADSDVSEQQQQGDSDATAGGRGEASDEVNDEQAWQAEIALDNGEPLVPGRVDFFA